MFNIPTKAKRPGLAGRSTYSDERDCGAAGSPLNPHGPSIRETAGPQASAWGGRGGAPRTLERRLSTAISRDRARVEILPRTNPRRTPSFPSVAACPETAAREP